jgi:hypothetical protein
MGRKTKRALSKTKIMTIPELKHSFDRIDNETGKILSTAAPMSEKVARFQKLWQSVFQKSVKKEAAEAYLAIKRKTRPRKTRKAQRGGMAPVSGYELGPGVSGPYGTYPAYVVNGLAPYHRGISEECGVKDIGPQIPADMGSAAVQAGGNSGIADMTTAFSMRPINPNIPPSTFESLQLSFQGRPQPPSSDPVSSTAPYISGSAYMTS